MSDLDKINSIFNAKIDSVKTKEDLQNIKTEFFGKNGQITLQFKSLGSLDSEKRKKFASNLNKIKDDLTHQLEQKNLEIETKEKQGASTIEQESSITPETPTENIEDLVLAYCPIQKSKLQDQFKP